MLYWLHQLREGNGEKTTKGRKWGEEDRRTGKREGGRREWKRREERKRRIGREGREGQGREEAESEIKSSGKGEGKEVRGGERKRRISKR